MQYGERIPGGTAASTWMSTGLVAYFVVAIGVSWLCAAPLVLAPRGLFPLDEASPWRTVLFFLAASGPTLSALAITAGQTGRAGLRLLLAKALLWRFSPYLYVVALLLPAVVILAGLGIFAIFGGSLPVRWLLPLLPVAVVRGVGAALGEEFGWRGFALPRLRALSNPLTASLYLGLLWCYWHLWLFFIPGTAQSTLPLSLFLLSTVGATMVYTWLVSRTGGSLLVAILFHASENLWLNALPILPATAGSLWPYGIAAATTAALGFALLAPSVRRT